MFRKYFFAFALFTLSLGSKAGHVLGGELSWECAGNGDYIFQLTIFTDCTSTFPSGQFINGPAGQIALQIDSTGYQVFNSNCSNTCLERKYTFSSAPVTLSGIPPLNGWEFYWSTCCRSYDQNLSGGGVGLYLSTKMFPYTPPGAASPVPADSCFSHSPQFGQDQPMMLCEGTYVYNNQVYDRDQDSLAVSFTSPVIGPGNAVSYASGYFFNAPYPDSTENLANGPVRLNPRNGEVRMEIYGASAGYYFAAFKVQEYRNGQLISEVVRDRPLIILDSTTCTPAANNSSPNLNLVSNNTLPLNQNGSVYRTSFMAGDTLDIDILASDFDFNSAGIPQTICLSANSLYLNPSNYTLNSGCANGDCATISPQGASSGFCGSVAESYRFQWTGPDCNQINNQPFSPLTYAFHIQVADNACPISKFAQATILVDLYPGPLFAPVLSVDAADTNGNVDLSWSKVQISPNSPFDRYMIYSRPVGGTFTALDSIYDIDSLQASYSGLPYPSEFFIKAFAGTCVFGSPSSNVESSEQNISLREHLVVERRFDLSPNPSKSRLTLSLSSGRALPAQSKVLIYNSSGALQRHFTLEQAQKTWQMQHNLEPGIYIVELEVSGVVQRQRLLVD